MHDLGAARARQPPLSIVQAAIEVAAALVVSDKGH